MDLLGDDSFIEEIKGEEERTTEKKIKSPKLGTYFSDQNEFVLHCYKLAALRKFPIYTSGNPGYRMVRCDGAGRGVDKCTWFVRSTREKGGKGGGTITERENAHTCVIEYPDEVEQKMLAQIRVFEKKVGVIQEKERISSNEIEESNGGIQLENLEKPTTENKLSKYPMLTETATQAAIGRLLAESPGVISLPSGTEVYEKCSTLVVLCAASAKSKGFVIRRQEVHPNAVNPLRIVYLCGHYFNDKAPSGVRCSYKMELKKDTESSGWYLIESGKHNHSVKKDPNSQQASDSSNLIPIPSTSTPKFTPKSSTIAAPVAKVLPLIASKSSTKRPTSPEAEDDVVISQKRQLPTPAISEPNSHVSPKISNPRLQSLPTHSQAPSSSSNTPIITNTIDKPLTMDTLKHFLYSVSPTIARFTSKFWEGGIRSKASLFYLCEMMEPELTEALIKVELGPLQRVLFVNEMKRIKLEKSY